MADLPAQLETDDEEERDTEEEDQADARGHSHRACDGVEQGREEPEGDDQQAGDHPEERVLLLELAPAQELDEVLAQLLAGEPLPPSGVLDRLADRIRILCTVYDPETGSYRVDYALAWEIAGGLTFILFMLLYMVNEWQTRKRQP